MSDDPPYLAGQLLLAMPGIGDPRFERSVIAICVHDEQGALGIMVSGAVEGLTVGDLMRQLDIEPGAALDDIPVLIGGPVEPGRGFVLHTPDYAGQSTVMVAGQWALTSTLDVLKDIVAGKGPRQWLAALGYTGWAPGQLDQEMTRHGWLATPGDTTLLFESAIDARWPLAFGRIGIRVQHLSAEAGRA